MASSICAVIDDSWGPYARGCRGGFDFTLLFEESVLTLLPLCLFLLVTPFRLVYLFNKKTKVVNSALLVWKLGFYASFFGIQVASLALWASPSAIRTKASLCTAAFAFVASTTLPLLSYLEHKRTIRPSSLLNVYLFSTLICDVPRARTLWLQQYNHSIATVMTLGMVIKFVLLLLEVLEKQDILLDAHKTSNPPEATAGILNRFFFWWLNSLFRQGFSQSLAVEDLFILDKHLRSRHLESVLQSAWNKVSQKTSNSLFIVTLNTLKWPLSWVILPRLCLVGFNFAQPFLINNAIDFTNDPDVSTNIGYGLVGAYIFVYFGIAISTGQYQHYTYRAITMARGGLISMLYSKTTLLDTTSVNPSSSLTLMSADIERITNGWQTMHEIWANCLEVALAMYLLERQLGSACALPIGVAIVSIAGSLTITSFVMSRQAMWLEAIERRIEATTAMLGAMKGVKMCGLTDILLTNIQQLRVEELVISKKFRRLLVWNLAFAYLTPVVAPVLTFAVFSVLARNGDGDQTLDTGRIFTSLSLFALLSDPLTSLIMAVVQFAGSIGSFTRIQEFLDTEIRKDKRERPADITIHEGYEGSNTKASSRSSDVGQEKIQIVPKAKGSMASISEISFVAQSASFGWNEEMPELLSNISLSIPRAKFTLLVGPVGCGKSTLLKGLLGEVPEMRGTIRITDSAIAYCDQTPWHMNGSIRDSIIALSPVDLDWYRVVLVACGLDEDLRQLPQGDKTMIGSKGIALSGGQSQRISLARAVYSQKSVLILDDVLSGLDAGTENRVFHNLLGKEGLLRRQNTTVILASSSAKRLSYADHIIALGSDSRIAEQGTFDELERAGGYVSTFAIGAADWDGYTSMGLQNRPVEEAQSINEESAAVTKALEADQGRANGDSAVYLYYVGSVGWFATIIFILAICGYAFCTSFPNIWANWWSAANTVDPNGNLGFWLGVYGALGAGALFSLIISVWQMLITMVPRSGENFHWQLLKTVLHAPMSFFASTDTGITLNRFSQDLQLIDMDLPLAALNTFATLVLCIAQMAIIGVESPFAAISYPLCIVVFYFVQKFYLRTSRQIRFLDLEAKSPLYSQFVECLNGLVTIRAFGWQNALTEKNLDLLDRSQRPFYLLWSIQRWLVLVLDLVVAGVAVLLMILVVTLRGRISAGAVGVALLNVILFSQNIKLLLQFWTTMETHIGAVSRIKNFTADTVPENLPTEHNQPPATWPSSGAIQFNNVSASYRPSQPVVRDVSISIGAGQKVAICGRTGSGKSSLIASLFRMIDVTGGNIVVDGVDIATLPRQEVRSRLIGVPQDSYILGGSVMFNADPTKSAAEESIVSALKSVQLWDIVSAKGGLDTNIDELFLTQGQKQLFCLARAMVRPSTILVLDEATSSVDSKTDELMQRIIRQRFSNHTIIAVAHKLDTVLDFDKVVLLDAGELKEFDSPHKLLADEKSEFCKLYRMFESKGKDGSN